MTEEPIAIESTESVSENGKQPHRIFGSKSPTAPLWKDRVASTNGGRAPTIKWENSVLKYIRPIIAEVEWKNVLVCREVVSSMRLMADRYEQVQKAIEIWDGFKDKEKGRIFSLDKACDIAHVDRDEIAGLVLSAVKKHVCRMLAGTAYALVERNFEKLIQASITFCLTGTKESSAERIRLLKMLESPGYMGAEIKPKGEGVRSEASASAPARSLDTDMASLDAIENIGVD